MTQQLRIQTCDPNCWIVEKTDGVVVYETTEGERWQITGTCNQCGECEVGSENPYIEWTGTPIGEPNACYDIRGEERPDSPVRPEIADNLTNCTLSGEYL